MTHNASLCAPIKSGDPVAAIDTPALVIDLDAMARNLATMATFAKERGLRLRPHAKTHKSATIAKLQMAAGALGVLRACKSGPGDSVFNAMNMGSARRRASQPRVGRMAVR